MRRRSGGIHSNSQQQYAQLADVAMQCSSLFYDEYKRTPVGKRRKYAFSQSLYQKISCNQPQQQEKKQNAFKDFNFDEHVYAFEKDKKQLQRFESKAQKRIKKSHVTILTRKRVVIIKQILSQMFSKQQNLTEKYFEEEEERFIDLFVHKYEEEDFQEGVNRIDCYWIISCGQAGPFDSLLQIYKQKAELIIQLEGEDMIGFGEESNKLDIKSRLEKQLGCLKQIRMKKIEKTN